MNVECRNKLRVKKVIVLQTSHLLYVLHKKNLTIRYCKTISAGRKQQVSLCSLTVTVMVTAAVVTRLGYCHNTLEHFSYHHTAQTKYNFYYRNFILSTIPSSWLGCMLIVWSNYNSMIVIRYTQVKCNDLHAYILIIIIIWIYTVPEST